ncbi:MAG: hypothetical protein H6607_09725 [Flavobacteriales bacterium]|nr:hypothetical protein [Flavobacteriales bacterium]
MKRLFGLTLLFVVLFGSTSFSEIFRLPALINHYQEHALLDNDSSILDFLTKHYLNKENHENEHPADHDELPFCGHSFHIAISFSTHNQPPFAMGSERGGNKKRMDYEPKMFSADVFNNVWQPPRVV